MATNKCIALAGSNVLFHPYYPYYHHTVLVLCWLRFPALVLGEGGCLASMDSTNEIEFSNVSDRFRRNLQLHIPIHAQAGNFAQPERGLWSIRWRINSDLVSDLGSSNVHISPFPPNRNPSVGCLSGGLFTCLAAESLRIRTPWEHQMKYNC